MEGKRSGRSTDGWMLGETEARIEGWRERELGEDADGKSSPNKSLS